MKLSKIARLDYVTLRIRKATKSKLKARSARKGLSMMDYVEYLLTNSGRFRNE